MIDVGAASQLLDFGARMGKGPRAEEQLQGAVAIHNLLEQRGVAYLADEVGMGKTYVALGALALFRHYQPGFRVLVIAPRENIQTKWIKEFRNFVAHNVRFPDMRVKALDGRPAKSLVACGNLLEFVNEVTLNPDRDFFLRATSFSLPVSGTDTVDSAVAFRLRDRLRRYLPWMRDEVFDLRNKQAFKDNFAKALCCALPVFDLVIVDEGHNLKHGFGPNVSSRNRVLGLAMGHPRAEASAKLFPGFSPRAHRVLFLSATPIEETYKHLWNQLDVFGKSAPFDALLKKDIEEEEAKAVAGQFLIRRVTSMQIGGKEYTKNLYRREWRRGGVHVYDEPIHVTDARQRMVVALVQKKVSEILGHEGFNTSFQVGMLASFESFLETTKVKRADVEEATFDDPGQTEVALEKDGIDVSNVNRLARSYRKRFRVEMPHPKMDALVASLSDSWMRGEKTLVFVRRVASVKELKRKLDEQYDEWLMARLLRELPDSLHQRLNGIFDRYRDEKIQAEESAAIRTATDLAPDADEMDHGGSDTFFAWFFRGSGPRGVVSGANIQQRFIQAGTAYATFFEDNYVADLLKCPLGDVGKHLAQILETQVPSLNAELRDRSRRFLSRAAKVARADRFRAVQAAAIAWLTERPSPYQEKARIIWHERLEAFLQLSAASHAPEIGDSLEIPTFFTEIRRRPLLCGRLWPRSSHVDPIHAFREQELRAQLLASAARLGHGLIDLYVMTVRRLGSLQLRAQESGDDDVPDRGLGRINEYLDLLEHQMNTPISNRGWRAFDELAEIASNFDLIIDVNEPDSRHDSLSRTATVLGRLLRNQQPVGGMSGQVNQTLVRQFRMPGYPFVLITTDVLQEGEDLHTFCSSVHHYGISWTPSSMEQRVGRIDRVRSQTDRRLSAPGSELKDEDKLQVYFPHLEDTVEVLQVHRVLERMNIFLRLMHEGLVTTGNEDRSINIANEFARGRRPVPQIRESLKSAFPVPPEYLTGDRKTLSVGPEWASELAKRFSRITVTPFSTLKIKWEPQTASTILLGTAFLNKRIQPFSLLLDSIGPHAVVRCISPVGCVHPSEVQSPLVNMASAGFVKIGAIMTTESRTYDLTVEGEVLLGRDTETDGPRIEMVVQRVVAQADAIEQEFLPGRDEILETFRNELAAEAGHDR